ncbi:MAG: cytochrome c3 family protein [Pseudomonadales bacterium]|mgnify:CR=1 FL=1|jgi:predicted glycoside hydrolase/deacetylase ChbG (UPF0249 family)|nr:cytochrome c3 family protein [Pseudomonadales bacterium]MDP6470646.1 cytochrome c3 family protein [Pseudomonadales bacterium]MDP6828498.1 cytochrome c3 family protein [Pseudomonadales bacterium]MDP6970517.1 cytochrome c3 family protein [Pseudomonadales bacterium]|tara:strand:+ start:151 stop:510 length:360 start_codon:yes stop_codon:yes gene_type:complete
MIYMPRVWLVAVIAALLALFATIAYLQDAHRSAAPVLPVTFAHLDHQQQQCIDCHHNFVDRTGIGLCIDCHKRDKTVSHLMEAQFHELCQSCHIENYSQGKDHGPTRACENCHTSDPYP